jgi:branched-chain amino acid aminotransferase
LSRGTLGIGQVTQLVDIGEVDSFASLGFPWSSYWLEQYSYGLIILIESIVHTAAMNGHAVETASHLIQNGVNAAKALVHEPEMHDLDVSKLTVSLTKSPGKVPEPDSLEIWDMKTCTDHSTGPISIFSSQLEPHAHTYNSFWASCLGIICFGIFADILTVVKVTWTDDVGWHAPTIEPYGQLTMSPIASCLHYATQCFEGLKVYRGFDGKLRLFRPDKNCARLVMSSARVALPTFNPKELEKLLKAFIKIDGPSKSSVSPLDV